MKTFQEFITEAKKCWPGYEKKGTQKLFGKTYNRCVKEEEYELDEDWSKEYKRSIDCSNPKGFSQKAHCAGRKKRAAGDETKSKSPFKEMYEIELDESSTGERSGRRTRGNVTLARGRGADMYRKERTTAAIAKKAGLKGTGKFSTKDLTTSPRDYTNNDDKYGYDNAGSTEQDHYIRTYSSPRKAAQDEDLISKRKPTGKRTAFGRMRNKTAPSSESVRRVKDLKTQMTKAGANQRERVHSVDIMHRDSHIRKGDTANQMERGRNFIQAIKDTPKHLKIAGAQRGDTVIGKPTAVMPGENPVTGAAKRAKLYRKIFGKKSSKASSKTGLMTGAVD